jgi:hypothetical protein
MPSKNLIFPKNSSRLPFFVNFRRFRPPAPELRWKVNKTDGNNENRGVCISWPPQLASVPTHPVKFESFNRDSQDIPESRREPILAGMSAEERLTSAAFGRNQTKIITPRMAERSHG